MNVFIFIQILLKSVFYVGRFLLIVQNFKNITFQITLLIKSLNLWNPHSENQLLHTDIKPENILMCGKDKRLIAIKDKLEQIKFKQVCENQLEEYKKKFDFSKKNAKDKYRKGKRKILLQIVDELARILKIEEIYDDLKYLQRFINLK